MGSILTVPAAEPAPFGYKYDEPMEVIPTGSFALDRALGIGGLPRGRLTEVLGSPPAATALALSCIVQAQQSGGVAAFIDVEHALDLKNARARGVDCSRMLLSQPDCGEQAMDVVEALVHSGQCTIIVVNGVSKLFAYPQSGDPPAYSNYPGRLLSRAMRKLAVKAHQTGTTVVFLNDSHVPTPAGNALKFYSSVRLIIGATEKADTVSVKVLKSKLAPPFATAEVDVLVTGFCKERGGL